MFSKIEDSLPDRILTQPSHDFTRFSFLGTSSTTIDPDIWQTVFSCLRSLNTLEMEYLSRQSRKPQFLSEELRAECRAMADMYPCP